MKALLLFTVISFGDNFQETTELPSMKMCREILQSTKDSYEVISEFKVDKFNEHGLTLTIPRGRTYITMTCTSLGE